MVPTAPLELEADAEVVLAVVETAISLVVVVIVLLGKVLAEIVEVELSVT
jgi:hypothetical protein